MAINLNKASKVITTITTQMTTPKKPIHDILKELNVPDSMITRMVDECHVIPCRYTVDQKETPKNIKEKRFPSSNDSITSWEVYIPLLFPTLQDFRAFNKHDFWVNTFKKSTFQSLKSVKGTVIDTPQICYTCKVINHTFHTCLIHKHPAWCCKHTKRALSTPTVCTMDREGEEGRVVSWQ